MRVLPTEYLPSGLALRGENPDDRPFLERLFVSNRAADPGFAAWPEQMRHTFLASQFDLQRRHYANAYAGGDFYIVEHNAGAVGRLCLFGTDHDVRVVDVSLTPESCGIGLGSALLRAVQRQAGMQGKTVSLNVEMSNPALRLYRRLGFEQTGQSGPYWHMIWYPST